MALITAAIIGQIAARGYTRAAQFRRWLPARQILLQEQVERALAAWLVAQRRPAPLPQGERGAVHQDGVGASSPAQGAGVRG